MLTFAVGGIHGCHRKLVGLLERCRSYSAGVSYRVVFLGDYVDRGPASRAVLDTLMSLQESQGDASVVVLLGNHEELLLRAFIDPSAKDQWLANGGVETLESYSGRDGEEAFVRHAEWLKSLPLSFDDGLRFFVHAGIDPTRPLNNQSQHDLLWIREPFLNFDGPFERLIVHGHTPVRTGPEIKHNRVNVDTGAVFSGQLTAAVFRQDQRKPLEFLTVTD